MEVLGWVIWGLACFLSLWGLFTFFREIFRPALFPRGHKACYPFDLRRLISGLYALGMMAAVVATAVLYISKLHLLWFVPLYHFFGIRWIGWIYLRYWYNAYYKIIARLKEARALLWDVCEHNVHLKKPPIIGELLRDFCRMYGNNKALISTETGELLWHACGALQEANRLYQENISDVSCQAEIDESIYSDKDLPSETGEKMQTYLNEAEDCFNSVDILLGVHRAHLPDFRLLKYLLIFYKKASHRPNI